MQSDRKKYNSDRLETRKPEKKKIINKANEGDRKTNRPKKQHPSKKSMEKKPYDQKTTGKGLVSRRSFDGSCPYAKKCGGCDYQGIAYEKKKKKKDKTFVYIKHTKTRKKTGTITNVFKVNLKKKKKSERN